MVIYVDLILNHLPASLDHLLSIHISFSIWKNEIQFCFESLKYYFDRINNLMKYLIDAFITILCVEELGENQKPLNWDARVQCNISNFELKGWKSN